MWYNTTYFINHLKNKIKKEEHTMEDEYVLKDFQALNSRINVIERETNWQKYNPIFKAIYEDGYSPDSESESDNDSDDN
jgi:hypothetical protein